jgi:hypothetical protein
MQLFNVTYAIVTPESAEQADYAETGFLLQNVTLREALQDFLNFGELESSCYPLSYTAHEWITARAAQDFRDGSQEERSLHFPAKLTKSSRKRIYKLIGLI